MNNRVYIFLIAIVLICFLCFCVFGETNGVIVEAVLNQQNKDIMDYYAQLRIPSIKVDASLYYTNNHYACCYDGLYQGGRINVKHDADLFAGINIDDKADIRSISNDHFVVECVEITDCIAIGQNLISLNGIIHDNGDILLCVYLRGLPIVRVYRWVFL